MGGVDHEVLVAFVRGPDDFNVKRERAGGRVSDSLGDRGGVADGVVVPPAGHVGVGGAQLVDELGELAVVRVSAGFSS